MVLREAVAPRNYAALARMPFVFPRPFDFARRYFLGTGDYPHDCVVRTPVGEVTLTLHSHHDTWTVNEIFARRDYRIGEDVRIVVDVGSNIGVSAAYFLSRNREARAFLFEPDPQNVERLRHNLEQFAGRWTLEEAAVGPESGTASFGREPTGRYGGIGVPGVEAIEVRVVGINEVLARVLAGENRIDLLKLDTEGLEVVTVEALRPEFLGRIGAIYFESEEPINPHPSSFSCAFANQTVRLTTRRRPG